MAVASLTGRTLGEIGARVGSLPGLGSAMQGGGTQALKLAVALESVESVGLTVGRKWWRVVLGRPEHSGDEYGRDVVGAWGDHGDPSPGRQSAGDTQQWAALAPAAREVAQ